MPDFNRSSSGIYQKDSSVYSVFHGTNAILLEDELNETQWNQIEQLASVMRERYSSGFAKKISINTLTDANSFFIQNETNSPFAVLVNGYQGHVGGNAAPGTNLPADNILYIKLNAPDISPRTDLVFLEFWFEILSSSDTLRKFGGSDTAIITNSMLDTRVGGETSRRVQLRWRLRTLNSTTDLATVTALTYSAQDSGIRYAKIEDGLYSAKIGVQTDAQLNTKSLDTVYGVPLFTVNRRANDTSVLVTDITDIHTQSQMTASALATDQAGQVIIENPVVVNNNFYVQDVNGNKVVTMDTSGKITTESMEISNTATVDGTLNISNGSGGTSTSIGPTGITSDNITINKNETISGNLYIKDASGNTTTTINKDSISTNVLNTTGAANIGGALNVTGEVTSRQVSLESSASGNSSLAFTKDSNDFGTTSGNGFRIEYNSTGSKLSFETGSGSTIKEAFNIASNGDVTFDNGLFVGTNQVWNAGNFDPTTKLGLSGGTLTGPLTLNADPSSALQAATKQYVDSIKTYTDGVVQGLDIKKSVRAATTQNITLSGLQTIDNVILVAGDRVLVKNQSTASQNGIYVAATGAWTRDTDADTSTKITPGMYVFIEEGQANIDTGWVLITTGTITLGTTALTFAQFGNLTTNVVKKAGDTMTGFLTLSADPTVNLHAATKQYVDAGDTTLNTAVSGKVAKAGDIMTGFLTLNANPTANLHATTKQYVDAADSTLNTAVNGKVAKAGDTMTGFLTLNADPTANLHAATKQYVDSADSKQLNLTGGTMTGVLTLSADPAGLLDASTKQYTDTKVTKAGDTMTGALTLNADPVNNLHAATKQYVDTRVKKSGDTMTGLLTLSGDPTTNLHAATKQYADGKVAKAGDTMTGALTLSGDPTVALHAATKQYADGKVAKTGDTMTGALTLNADPSSALQAATKQYVDTRVKKSGDTMTGTLTLNADPAGNMDAATKRYVDNSVSTLASSTTVSGKVNRSGDTMSGILTLSANPVGALDAATKQYVDNMAAGINVKPAVKAATAGSNITLSGTQTIDTIVLAAGDRILVKDQTDATTNGVYVVATGAWARATDSDATGEVVSGTYYYVNQGVVNGGTGWIVGTANPITIGTTPLTFNQFTGQTQLTAGTGLTKTGNTLAHAVTTSITSVNNTNGNVIQSVGIDSMGHVTSLSSSNLDNRYVQKAGDTMTGLLTLSGDPTATNHAATKNYVDNKQLNQTRANITISADGTTTANIGSYDSSREVLFVYQNGMFLQENVDYTYNSATTSIVISSGTWNSGTVISTVKISVATAGTTGYSTDTVVLDGGTF